MQMATVSLLNVTALQAKATGLLAQRNSVCGNSEMVCKNRDTEHTTIATAWLNNQISRDEFVLLVTMNWVTYSAK